MPPKRKRGGGAGRGRGGKKAKTSADDDEDVASPPAPTAAVATRSKGRGRKAKKADDASDAEAEPEPEPEPEPEVLSTTGKMIESLKKAGDKKRTPKIDQLCPLSKYTGAKVHEDYDCMLNQTNIGNNNNKYYIIQVIEVGGHYYHWNRWGRVGESGANALSGRMTMEKAVKAFEKKFSDKTKNKWSEREKFSAVSGKYTLLEMGDDGDEDDGAPQQPVAVKSKVETLPCTLDKPTQDLIKLIFNNDMFNEAMRNLEIDVKKMPLGKISKAQIAKGFEALEKISEALKQNRRFHLNDLSSKFYTVIPHDFGRQRPLAITSEEMLQKKMDLLTILGDIEVAQSIQKEENKDSDSKAAAAKPPHDLDYKYGLLQCDITLLDKSSTLFDTLKTYLEATKGRNVQILDIWEVNRHSEGKRFAANDAIKHRKLLWHGTNVAVVVAILKSGLRIMPHSGGRVGRGIYFASENGKSASYVSCAGNTGIMFLNEVALGKEHHITMDDSSLRIAPKGFDSIVAKGRTEPDPTKDTEIILDSHKVIVPQGKPLVQPQFSNSSFSQSEYLIYREDQCRIRFILKLQF